MSKNTWMLPILVSSWALGTGISVQQEALLSPEAESAARKKKVKIAVSFLLPKKGGKGVPNHQYDHPY